MAAVVVTGAASGIGRASAEALVRDGRQVVLWDLSPAVADVGEALGMPSAVVDVTADLAGPVAEAAGAGDGIDGLVHAAGTVAVEPVGAYTAESWDFVQAVNLRAHALLVQELLPHLQRSPGAAVVGISSIEGIAANPFIPAYCASKAGMIGLTKSMAAQLGPEGIRVNCVCPGFIVTPMIQQALDIEEIRAGFEQAAPLQRMGQPSEVGEVVAFLMSPRASFVTGTEVVVDGGLICKH